MPEATFDPSEYLAFRGRTVQPYEGERQLDRVMGYTPSGGWERLDRSTMSKEDIEGFEGAFGSVAWMTKNYRDLYPYKPGGSNAEGSYDGPRDFTSQIELLEDQAAFREHVFGPLERSVLDEAMQPIDVRARKEQASADLERGAIKADEMTSRSLDRYGLDYESEDFDRVRREVGMLRSAAEAGARNTIGRDAPSEQRAKTAQVAQLLQNIPAQTSSALGSMQGTSAMLGAQQSAAYGNLAQLGMSLSNMNWGKTPAYTGKVGSSFSTAVPTATATPGYQLGGLSLGGNMDY